jgi:hypothetical protein
MFMQPPNIPGASVTGLAWVNDTGLIIGSYVNASTAAPTS